MNRRLLLQAGLLTVIAGALYTDGRLGPFVARSYRTFRFGSSGRPGVPQPVVHVDSSGALHTAPPHDTIPARTQTWDLGKLLARLAASGVDMTCAKPTAQESKCSETRTVRQPFMMAEGALIQVDGAELQAFFYGDANARAADTDKLDPVRVAPPTMSILWIARPSLVVNNNLALIVLTKDESLRRKLTKALAQ